MLLTINPAAYFKADDAGRIVAGMRGDLVVLDGDPAVDARNLARVAQTIRDGRVICTLPTAGAPSAALRHEER